MILFLVYFIIKAFIKKAFLCYNARMIISWIFLVVGFVLLIRGADAFVDGAVGIARRFRIPAIVIGTTLVAIGTSAPEAAISITAALHESDGVSIGNVIGSNITNIFLILGITALIGAPIIHKSTKFIELPFVGFITIIMCVMGMWFGKISRISGLILLGLFVIFLCYMTILAYKSKREIKEFKIMPLSETIIVIVAGIIALIIGANMVTKSATDIARHFGISERVIGLTLIAFGTSLPELVVTIAATIKHEFDMAIGNIVGSNIFNILFVLGIAAAIQPMPFSSAFLTDGAIALLAVTMLMIFVARKSKLSHIAGILFIASYAAYIWYLI